MNEQRQPIEQAKEAIERAKVFRKWIMDNFNKARHHSQESGGRWNIDHLEDLVKAAQSAFIGTGQPQQLHYAILREIEAYIQMAYVAGTSGFDLPNNREELIAYVLGHPEIKEYVQSPDRRKDFPAILLPELPFYL